MPLICIYLLFFKIETVVAGLDGNNVVTCSRGVFVKPDTSLEEAKKVYSLQNTLLLLVMNSCDIGLLGTVLAIHMLQYVDL